MNAFQDSSLWQSGGGLPGFNILDWSASKFLLTKNNIDDDDFHLSNFPAFTFDGVDDYLSKANATINWGAGNFWIFAVFLRDGALNASQRLFHHSGAGKYIQLLAQETVGSDGGVIVIYDGINFKQYASPALNDNQVYFFAGYNDKANLRLGYSINGANWTYSAYGAMNDLSIANGTINIGKAIGLANYFSGRIYEMGIYINSCDNAKVKFYYDNCFSHLNGLV